MQRWRLQRSLDWHRIGRVASALSVIESTMNCAAWRPYRATPRIRWFANRFAGVKTKLLQGSISFHRIDYWLYAAYLPAIPLVRPDHTLEAS